MDNTEAFNKELARTRHFHDTGCSLHPKCLECPREICIHDEPMQFKSEQRKVRDKRIAYAYQKNNLNVELTAQETRVSYRTVFRALQRLREDI